MQSVNDMADRKGRPIYLIAGGIRAFDFFFRLGFDHGSDVAIKQKNEQDPEELLLYGMLRTPIEAESTSTVKSMRMRTVNRNTFHHLGLSRENLESDAVTKSTNRKRSKKSKHLQIA